MGHPYYRQAKFAQYRFRPKDSVQAHEAAYLASKEVETFRLPKKPQSPSTTAYLEAKKTMPKEVFCQCWKCLSVMTLDVNLTLAQEIRCRYCNGSVEVLMINGEPQP